MAVNLQQLEKEGIYQAESALPSLLSDLDQIAGFASVVAARKRSQRRTAGFIILGGVVGTVLAAIVFPMLLLISIPAIIGGFVWLIYSFVSKGALLARPKRLAIARECLVMVQPDAKPEKPFTLRLALMSKPLQLSHEAWHGRKNGKQEFLEESWLSLQGPLLDGTVLNDQIKELTRKRPYSNARGKHKSKSRVTYLVNVRFSYPKERYGDARPAEQALKGDVKLGPSATLRGVRVSEKAITLKAMASSEQDIAATAGMLSMGGYRILNLARRMAVRGKAS